MFKVLLFLLLLYFLKGSSSQGYLFTSGFMLFLSLALILIDDDLYELPPTLMLSSSFLYCLFRVIKPETDNFIILKLQLFFFFFCQRLGEQMNS